MDEYRVNGMSCAACVAHVEKAVRSVPGVEEVSVSLLTNSMSVQGTAQSSEICAAVAAAGYEAEPKGGAGTDAVHSMGEDDLADRQTPKLLARLLFSLALLSPLMYLSMGHMLWGWPLPEFLQDNHVGMGICQMLFATAILVINQRFFISGTKSVLHGAPNMDTLVALGAGVSYGYSVYTLLAMTQAQTAGDADAVMGFMDQFYFESAATIVTLITVGKLLEAYSKGRTTDALKGLMRLAPKTAVVVRDGQEIKVPIERLVIGDQYIVRPGESIPVDGRVVSGEAAIDASAMTGESVPVDVSAGDEVIGGTINTSGYLTCEATRIGQDTTLSQIIRLVGDAAASKAPIARTADRVAAVFVSAGSISRGMCDGGCVAAFRAERGICPDPCDRCAGDQLSVRAGAGDTGSDHGRQRRWRPQWHTLQDGSGAGAGWQCQGCRLRQDRNGHRGTAACDGCPAE